MFSLGNNSFWVLLFYSPGSGSACCLWRIPCLSLKSAMFQTGDRVQFTKEGHRNIEAGRQGIVKSLNNLWLQVLYDGDSKTKGTRRAHAKLIASHSTSDLASNSAELGDREKAVKKA